MNLDQIKSLTTMMGVKIKSVGPKWVRFSCPFSPWLHRNHGDRSASFAISIDPDDRSSFKCYACHEEGVMPALIGRMQEVAYRSAKPITLNKEIAKFVDDSNIVSFTKKAEVLLVKKAQIDARLYSAPKIEEPEPEVKILPESDLDAFELPFGIGLDYLLGPDRRLNWDIIDTFELSWHPPSKRIAIPIRNREGRLVGISGRSVVGAEPKFLHGTGFRKDYVLYGAHLCQGGEVGYLVEGFFDVHRLYDMGYRNAVAMMGTSLSTWQQRELKRMFNRLVVVLDGDVAGYEGAAKVQKQLGEVMTKGLKVIDLPAGLDPDDLTLDQAATLLGPPQVDRSKETEEWGLDESVITS